MEGTGNITLTTPKPIQASGVIHLSSLAIYSGSIHLSSLDDSEDINLSPSLEACTICFAGNPCHNRSDGKFCKGDPGGGGGGEVGKIGAPASGEFSPEVEKAIRDFGHKPEEYGVDLKPIPGTDSWRDAHGISKEVYDARPMKRWEDKNDPVFDSAFEGFPPNQKRFAKTTIAGQSTGFIMIRKGAPGAEEIFGKVPPQARPDVPIVVDQRRKARLQRELSSAERRAEKVNNSEFTANDVIIERQARVNRAKAEVKQLQTQTADEIRLNAQQIKDKADVNLHKAQKSGDVERIAAAQIKAREADYIARDEKRKAALSEKDQPRAIAIAQQEQRRSEAALDKAKSDPEKALKNVREYSADQIVDRQKKLDGAAVKYVFPPGEGNAARIEVNQDKQNVKNLVGGKDKVYFIMEGNLKADAALTHVKREDPKAAVVSVPSVTAWSKEETDWVAQKYLKGRDIVLVPDADGVTNPAVVAQAKQLGGRLRANGVKNVIIASPPLVKGAGKGGKLQVEDLTYPTGKKDGRKGLDDHLGLGKGTLGDLTYSDSKPPKFDLTDLSKQHKIRSSSVTNSNRTLEAISDLAGERGAGKISDKSIEKYTNLAPSSVNDSIKQLEKMGVIKVNHIFDPGLLGQGRRVQALEYDEIKRLTKKAGAKLPNLDIKYVDDFNNHEIAPIIEIINPKFLTNPGPTKSLASTYKNLKTSSPVVKTPSRPGVRLVQSAEGAKRYGVSIGQPIPEGGPDLGVTGTISLHNRVSDAPNLEITGGPALGTTGIIRMVPICTVCFAGNLCHNRSDGKFCGGKGGGGGGGSSKTTIATKEKGPNKADRATRNKAEAKDLLDIASNVTVKKSLMGGRSGASVALVSGPKGKAVIKGDLPTSAVDREYLVSKVGKALGAPVPKVARKDSHTIVAEFIPGTVAGTFSRDIGRIIPLNDKARRDAVKLKGARGLALLDIAVANADRHGGNILIRPNGKSIVGIDHTTSFGGKAFLGIRPSKALERHWRSSFTKTDYQRALSKIEPLKADFTDLGHADWYDSMHERLSQGAGL